MKKSWRKNLVAQDKTLDVRDVSYEKLGSSRVLPEEHESPGLKKFYRSSQKNTPTCGAHAGAHAKQFLDFKDTGNQKYSPFYLWKKIKKIDGFPPSVGTDLRSILKTLKSWGVCDLALLKYQGDKPIQVYSADDTTKEQDENAQPRIIGSYAFMGNNRELIKQAIYDNGAAILLLRFGDAWWGRKKMVSNEDQSYGHFVVAYGWNGDTLKVICSADDKAPEKELEYSFNISDSGVLTDVPDEDIRKLITKRELLQRVVELLKLLHIIKK